MSQHSPSLDKAPGFQQCNPVLVRQFLQVDVFVSTALIIVLPCKVQYSDDSAEGHSQIFGEEEQLDTKSC